MTEVLLSVVGASSGVLSLLAVLYAFGFKLGRLQTQVDLLWKIDVEDSLRRQRQAGYISAQSEDALTERFFREKGDSVSELMTASCERMIAKKLPIDDGQLAITIQKALGWESVLNHSRILDLPIHDFLALAVTRVRMMQRALTT